MNLFLRRALFPLIVIALLGYLAIQTLGGEDETRAPTRITADYPRASTTTAHEPPLAEGAAREDTKSFWSRWPITPLLLFAPFVLIAFWANRRRSRIPNEDLRAS